MRTRIPLLILAIAARAPLAVSQEITSIRPDPRSGSAGAVVVRDLPLVHTAQLLPLDAGGEVVSPDDAKAQAERVVGALNRVLESCGSDPGRLVRVNVYATRRDHLPAMRDALAKSLAGRRSLPAVTWSVTPLPRAGASVALDAVAVAGDAVAGDPVARKRIEGLPEMSGPTHAAILPAGTAVYVSGMVGKGDMGTATRSAMEQLAGVVGGLGLSMDHVVHVKTFLRPMSDADAATRAIVDVFGAKNPPPISHLAWTLGDPIEIELVVAGKGLAIAATDPGPVQYYNPPGVEPSRYFSRVAIVRGGPRIFTGSVVSPDPGDPRADVRGMFRELLSLLREAGSDLEHMAKATYFVQDDATSQAHNEVRRELYNPERPPAASKAGVEATAFEGRASVVDMIAVPANR
jgi:enamine deaminase RidA (YjgF/YER057c/UK114 family)